MLLKLIGGILGTRKSDKLYFLTSLNFMEMM